MQDKSDKQPLVYIVLVNYNGYKDTIECVESIRNISYNNFKIIIVDNCSQDDSERILRNNLKDCIIIQSGSNLGFSGANNLGIKYAQENKAEYVLLLNNDTVVTESFLDRLVEITKRNDDNIIAISKILYFSQAKKIWYAGGVYRKYRGNVYHIGDGEKDNGQYDKGKFVTFATGCCILIPINIINNVGLLEEKYFLYYEDADYSCRVINSGYKIYYYPESVIYHKVSSSTGSLSPITQYYYYRNRSIFINTFLCKKIDKIIAFGYFYLTILLRVFKKEQNNKIIFRAITDFYKGKTGSTFNN